MEYPWRPRPPNGNFCPVCANSHFPFCPPPLPQHFRPPPPPPDQYYHTLPPPIPGPSYDPLVDYQGPSPVDPFPPSPVQIPHRPWCENPNFARDYYGNSNMGLDYDCNGPVGSKRMRFDNVNGRYANSLAEDERRLKLVRDHGAASRGLDKNFDGGYGLSNHSSDPSNFSDGGNFGDRFQETEVGYRLDFNSHMKPNYGELRFSHQHAEINKNVDLGRSHYNQIESSMVHNNVYENSAHGADGYNNYNHPAGNQGIPPYDNVSYHEQRRRLAAGSHDNQFLQSRASQQQIVEPNSDFYGLPNHSDHARLVQVSPGFKVQPPLPNSPPPPLPAEPPQFRTPESVVSASVSRTSSLFPISVDPVSSLRPPHTMISEGITSVSTNYWSKANPNSSGYHQEEIQPITTASSKKYKVESEDKSKIIDASNILKYPHHADRPDHIVIILRGLPGSGKSYLAKILRDLEVENGGTAPRIHSMDEYFMTEVEKVEESEGSRSSGSIRGKKPVMKKVMEYCYEPEMEEAYRSSMLKAFKKTLDDGNFPFVIVDDRNLRVADFALFWATAKRSGYEVYLLEATYKDPAGCAARNIHGFTQNDIQKMADQWEEAPSLYMKLDSKSLLHGDHLEEHGIQEVDMDTEDLSGSEDTLIEKFAKPIEGDFASDGPSKDGRDEDDVEAHQVEVVKELGKSKWSNNLDEDDVHKTEATSANASALTNLINSYSKKGKSVRWADKVGSVGFSIGAGKTANVSLVIGPGSGYNLKSNPLPEEEKLTQSAGGLRRRNIFQEQMRAEHESFKAVFDKRRHRIGGLNGDEE